MKNGEAKHIVIYGTFNEKQYFLNEFCDKYDIIGFNANIVAYAPSAIGAFISNLKRKSFFIDPQTYAFQQDIRAIQIKKENANEFTLKKSVLNLADIYGSIIKENCNKRKLRANEIKNKDAIELSRNILEFQLNKIKNVIKDSGVNEFLEDEVDQIRPEFLIAPYFYINVDSMESVLELNHSFYETSIQIRDELCADETSTKIPLFAQVVLDKEIINDPTLIDKVFYKYDDINPEGIVLWINDFSELNASKYFLLRYVEFLERIRKKINIPVISLHGSYFSVILSSREYAYLAAVGHGIEYGESRPITPVGGGVPTSKFYFPKFYERLNYNPDAIEILLDLQCISDINDYFKKVCDCPTCRKIIQNDVMQDFSNYGETKISLKGKQNRAFPTATSQDLTRRHYLNSKHKEYEFCKNATSDDIISKLENSVDLSNSVFSHSFEHLERWYDILRHYYS